MNVEDLCANCLMHGWDQVSDKSKLQRCESCHVVLYCGKECQKEHWFKLHKNQCMYLKYFKDPDTAAGMQHKREDCAVCKQADKVGEFMLKKPDNPNYGCVYTGFTWRGSPIHHPHPFSITGQSEDTYEKGVIVLLNLLRKVELTQPRVKRNCKKELDSEFAKLIVNLCFIWRNQKIFPKSDSNLDYPVHLDFFLIYDKVTKTCKKREYMKGPFDLWKVIQLVNSILSYAFFTKHLLSLRKPLMDMDFPEEFELLLYDGLNNSDKFLARINQIFDALTNQLVPYQDIISIICGGSCEKTCSLCSKEITISNYHIFSHEKGAVALFDGLFMDEYFCEKKDCRDKMDLRKEEIKKLHVSVYSMFSERKKMRCDYCYQLPSLKDVHRCNVCLSTMYCSKDCQAKDWKVHQKVCKEDLEERKKKSGKKDRKEEAKDALESLEESLIKFTVSEEEARCRSDIVNKFKAKNDNRVEQPQFE